MNMTPNTTAEESFSTKVFKIVWVALFLSLFLYWHMMYITFPQKNNGLALRDILPGNNNIFEVVFLILAAAIMILYFFIPPFIFRVRKKSISGWDSLDLSSRAKHFLPIFLIRLALLESVTLYGFLVALFLKEPNKILPYLAVSAVGFLVNFPSKSRIGHSIGI